ncbi:MAG: TIGR02679 domain-containing protein [Defluviitaleaceae bacterium]|nr:TIGR02679 domain-containing protein [Defluviitaleaceae bacterium]
MQVVLECVGHIKESAGFGRLMEGLFEAYARHGRCFGAVRLADPAPEEEAAVSGYFGRDYYDQALIRIGLADFERQSQKLFGREAKLDAVLEAYFNKRVARRQGSRTDLGEFGTFIETELAPRYSGTEAGAWLDEVCAHMRRSYRAAAQAYAENPREAGDMARNICEAINKLAAKKYAAASRPKNVSTGALSRSPVFSSPPAPSIPLSEFSSKITGDPHALSPAGTHGDLFARALAWLYKSRYPSNPEEFCALYLKAGFVCLGQASLVHVRGVKASHGQTPCESCDFYNKRREAFALTLENIGGFDRAEPFGNKVYVIKNLEAFSAVCERTRGFDRTVVCASGGLNAAFALLIDKMGAGSPKLYFSCDMDFAGLSVADAVYLRYPRQFVPWRLDKADYESAAPDGELALTDRQKETGLHCEELASLFSAMRKNGKTVSQSSLVEQLSRDVCEGI